MSEETWYSVDLGDGVEAFHPTNEIQDAFFLAYAIPNHLKNMAAFSRYDLETNIVTVYFTPNAERIAKHFKASPCEKPSSKGIGLLVGDMSCWQTFFPERIQQAIQRRRTIND